LTLQLYWLRKEDKGIPEVPVDVDIPHEFLCPITHEIMHDPVLSSGKGNTFYASGVTDTQTIGISPRDSHPFQSFLTWMCLTAGGYVRSDASDLTLAHSHSHK
jgi:hypothetical protein